MLAKVDSAALVGIDGVPVSVEVDVSNGLPSFTTVGLPDSSVRESKDRVKAAIRNSGYDFPTRKITVNLAPASIRKEGSSFDLPIALGILITTGLLDSQALNGYLAVGELSLDGSLMPVSGVLPVALTAAEMGCSGVIVPYDNYREAKLGGSINIIPARHLYEVVEICKGVREASVPEEIDDPPGDFRYRVCFEDIRGQQSAKRAFEIAAAGMHNLLMQGPPGTGKTMIARALPSILADWTREERLETTRIYSITRKANNTALMCCRPFRSPHHTVSDAGLIGGGSYPRPGEVSLAHNGVLFLDELPEFRKQVLEALRQPMEDGCVTISRAQSSLSYPASFMLVAAMNPCPCGFFGDKEKGCHCNELQIHRYRSKLSGPLLDRIDLHIEVPRVDFDKFHETTDTETSEQIRMRVNQARSVQVERFNNHRSVFSNSRMNTRDIEKFCKIDNKSRQLLAQSVRKLQLSARAYHKILKIARTIADLDGSGSIEWNHVAEAIHYRRHEID
ncbi:MAG: YifB family Mg chelatase-like AAA ATPase [Desulfofustis sp.]|nr:YifB family Mg chelatase-like AAA ATPase [Desulfofustis sp.]